MEDKLRIVAIMSAVVGACVALYALFLALMKL